jgi:hypothetical protein
MAGAYESGEDIDGIGMAAGNDSGVNTRVDGIQAGGGMLVVSLQLAGMREE